MNEEQRFMDITNLKKYYFFIMAKLMLYNMTCGNPLFIYNYSFITQQRRQVFKRVRCRPLKTNYRQ